MRLPVGLINRLRLIETASGMRIRNLTTWRTDYYRLGVFHISLKEFDKASELLTQALILNPQMAEVYCAVGRMQSVQGKLEQALESCRTGILIKSDVPCLHSEMAVVLSRLERLDEAETASQELIKIAPKVATGYLQLAQILIARSLAGGE